MNPGSAANGGLYTNIGRGKNGENFSKCYCA